MYLLPPSLFILLLTLSACTARPLADVEEVSSNQINISVKVSENAKKQVLKSNGATTEDIKVKNHIGAVREEEERSKQHMNKAHHLNYKALKSSVSVSWSVAHSKLQDHDSELYSDYSRPTTRPPSHN